MPPLWAASNFSLRPPIGSTSPLNVISPVMATSLFTGMSVNADTSEVHMPTPADGPSFGVAPSGTCTCTSNFWWKSSSTPRTSARLLTTVIAAWMDSVMTSPSWPVCVSLPLPGTTAASIVSSSPPTSVQARPVTWPTCAFSSALPKR